MNEMIERVAREIRRDSFIRNGTGKHFNASLPLTHPEISAARAAILAMREPTEEMIPPSSIPGWSLIALGIWQAMIDAALISTPPKEREG